MSVGQLVTFILYLSVLADAFNSLAGIYATLTGALAGADKVFELMNRKPRCRLPKHVSAERIEAAVSAYKKRLGGVEYTCTDVATKRVSGLNPEACDGIITLKNVKMSYPARPQRTILNNLSLTIPSGSVVALVGSSGSGKSAIVSLIQNLYEPSEGDVCIDGIPVRMNICGSIVSRKNDDGLK